MASNGPTDEPSGHTYDTLRRLERRLDEASEAAERLIAEAAASAAASASGSASRKPPAAGWEPPRDEDGRDSGRSGDMDLLVQVLQSVRDLIPPDLQRRLAEALREVLLALRAVIDWYVERIEARRSEPTEVQDIPIV
jgi:hypothetical protein